MRNLCRIRSDAYFCFSMCFDYPAATLVEPATIETISKTLNLLQRVLGLETLASSVDLFTEELSRSVDASCAPLLRLQIEYNRLFIGPSNPQAYPCENAFLNQSGWATDSTRDIAREYLKGGLKLAPGFKDSPDHISLEFEFMSHLCKKELIEQETRGAPGVSIFQQQQSSFLESHIVNWAPAFLATVERSAVVGFYKLLARITRGFVIWDYAHVEQLARQHERCSYANV